MQSMGDSERRMLEQIQRELQSGKPTRQQEEKTARQLSLISKPLKETLAAKKDAEYMLPKPLTSSCPRKDRGPFNPRDFDAEEPRVTQWPRREMHETVLNSQKFDVESVTDIDEPRERQRSKKEEQEAVMGNTRLSSHERMEAFRDLLEAETGVHVGFEQITRQRTPIPEGDTFQVRPSPWNKVDDEVRDNLSSTRVPHRPRVVTRPSCPDESSIMRSQPGPAYVTPGIDPSYNSYQTHEPHRSISRPGLPINPKALQYDGKSNWLAFRRKFELCAKVNRWT